MTEPESAGCYRTAAPRARGRSESLGAFGESDDCGRGP